jgi:hypothetical protein
MTLFLWPKSQKYKFQNKYINYSKSKLNYIENFFSKKYNSKYCALTPSARTGIILSLKFKKFNKSKIVQLPRWSSNCLTNAVGSLSSINCLEANVDCKIVVHHLGQSFDVKKNKSLLIDDSSDSLPLEKFTSCKKSKYSEVISLPKIIGSYAGGIVLTNNKFLYAYIKNHQDKDLELAKYQSIQKYNSMIKNSKNYSWHYNEIVNFSLDYNTVNNIFRNLIYFDINKNIIIKRKKLFSNYALYDDKYRLGPCLLFNLKKNNKQKLNAYHFNITKNIDKQNYKEITVLPIHFGVSDLEVEKFYNLII